MKYAASRASFADILCKQRKAPIFDSLSTNFKEGVICIAGPFKLLNMVTKKMIQSF